MPKRFSKNTVIRTRLEDRVTQLGVQVRQYQKKVARLEDEIAQAKAIAGPMSVMFPATRTLNVLNPTTKLRLPQSAAGLTPPWENETRDCTDKLVSLVQLTASIQVDAHSRHIHCMLNVDGMPKSAYAISEEALRDTPRESLVEMIMAAMTQNLAKQLYSTTRRAP